MSARATRVLWWIVAALWAFVVALAIATPLNAAPRGDATYPAYVLAYTYDGPVELAGPVLDFMYAPDGLVLVLRSAGDGIYRNGFGAQE